MKSGLASSNVAKLQFAKNVCSICIFVFSNVKFLFLPAVTVIYCLKFLLGFSTNTALSYFTLAYEMLEQAEYSS